MTIKSVKTFLGKIATDDWKNESESIFYSWKKEIADSWERERIRKNTKPNHVGEVKKSLFGFIKRGNKNE